jgi:hypothetical protein
MNQKLIIIFNYIFAREDEKGEKKQKKKTFLTWHCLPRQPFLRFKCLKPQKFLTWQTVPRQKSFFSPFLLFLSKK